MLPSMKCTVLKVDKATKNRYRTDNLSKACESDNLLYFFQEFGSVLIIGIRWVNMQTIMRAEIFKIVIIRKIWKANFLTLEIFPEKIIYWINARERFE